MKQRNLDGYFFKVKRDGDIENVCFSDLTHEERYDVLKPFDKDSLKSLAIGLADALEFIGKEFDIEFVPVENNL